MTVKEEERTFSVAAIREGTVIDHIGAGRALKLLQLLNLETNERLVTIGINLPSISHRLKDIIKVEKYELSDDELHKVAVIAPHASINIIRDYCVDKKFCVQVPSEVSGIFLCPNRSCITNIEQMPTRFKVKRFRKGIHLQCCYCTKQFSHEEIK